MFLWWWDLNGKGTELRGTCAEVQVRMREAEADGSRAKDHMPMASESDWGEMKDNSSETTNARTLYVK